MNKGKKYTAKQICDFVNCGRFSLNQSSVEPRTISHLVNSAKYSAGSMLYDVKVEKRHGYNYYWVT